MTRAGGSDTPMQDHFDPAAAPPRLSVVVPCYNEEECIAETHRRLTETAQESVEGDYELVYVNDGSTDETLARLVALGADDPHVVIIDLSRNHGHQLALSAGLSLCRGERIFIIDADLQDPPELLPQFMEALDRGADVAYGHRLSREAESVFKKATAKLFYRLLAQSTRVSIPVDTGDFRLMSRRVLNVVLAMPESHRFIRGMIAWAGFRQVPVDYHRKERFAGQSKYPLGKMLLLAADALTGFGTAPLRSLYILGLAAVLGSLLLIIWSVVQYFRFNVVPGWSSLMVVFLTISSIQLVSLAFIGEYVGRIFEQSKNRPLFVIRDVIVSGKAQERRLPADNPR